MRLESWHCSFFWFGTDCWFWVWNIMIGGWVDLDWTFMRWEKCWISFSGFGTDCCFLLDGSMQTRVWNIMIGGRALIQSFGYKLLVSSRRSLLYMECIHIIFLVNTKSTFKYVWPPDSIVKMNWKFDPYIFSFIRFLLCSPWPLLHPKTPNRLRSTQRTGLTYGHIPVNLCGLRLWQGYRTWFRV